jgi:hypothetical protein
LRASRLCVKIISRTPRPSANSPLAPARSAEACSSRTRRAQLPPLPPRAATRPETQRAAHREPRTRMPPRCTIHRFSARKPAPETLATAVPGPLQKGQAHRLAPARSARFAPTGSTAAQAIAPASRPLRQARSSQPPHPIHFQRRECFPPIESRPSGPPSRAREGSDRPGPVSSARNF